MYLIGSSPTLEITRIAAMFFGLFSGLMIGNQAAASFEVVPPSLRATTVGILNFIGCAASGFAPFLGGAARRTIGVNQVMTYTAIAYAFVALILALVVLRYFDRDHRHTQEL